MGVFSGVRARAILRELGFPILVGVNRVESRGRRLVNEVFGEYVAL